MMVKESARLIAKGQLTEQAYKNFGILGGIAANVYSAVSETASRHAELDAVAGGLLHHPRPPEAGTAQAAHRDQRPALAGSRPSTLKRGARSISCATSASRTARCRRAT